MLQAFRTHKRWMMFIASFFIVPSFVVTGVYSYNRMIQSEEKVAEIDGEGISPQEFDNAKRQYLDNVRRAQGSQFNAASFDTQAARAMILDYLLNERALKLEIAKSHVLVSESDAINLIKSAGVFQKNGKFSPEAYQNYLHATGKSDAIFVNELRADMARDVLTGTITRTTLESEFGAKVLFDVMREERTVRYASISSQDFMKTSKPDAKDVRAFYDANLDAFKVAENVDIEYVTLSPASYTNITVNEDEVRAFYEQNATRFTVAETRRASHILVRGEDDKALAKAKSLLEQAKKNPKRFAALAKANSEDPGSAQKGGDLGFFGRGAMVAPFEKAVFEAKKGEIVGPVKTDFGYHVIYVTDLKPSRQQPLAEVRADIEKLYRNNQALRLFANDAETFSNMVYEQSESLAPVIERFKLKPEKLSGVTRNFTDELITPQVSEALFSFDVLKDKRNTSAIEVASNTLLSARVTAHHPESVLPFEEVRPQIENLLTRRNAMAAAKAQAEKLLARYEAGDRNALRFGKPVTVSRQAPQGVPVSALNALMLAKVPQRIVAQGDSAWLVVDVQKSAVPEATQDELAGLKSQLLGMFMPGESRAYLSALKTKYEAKVLNKDYLPEKK